MKRRICADADFVADILTKIAAKRELWEARRVYLRQARALVPRPIPILLQN